MLYDGIRDHPGIATNGDEIELPGDRAAALTTQQPASCRKEVLTLEVLDLNAVIAQTTAMLRRIVGEEVAIDVVPGSALGLVMADQRQIEQTLVNLAVSVRDAVPRGGSLRIATVNAVLDADSTRRHLGSQAGPYVGVTVTVIGSGMGPEVLAHLTEPFDTAGPDGRGTGIGFGTVRDIVSTCGGYISVPSREDSGTAVTIYWPTHQAAAPAAALGRRPELDGHGTETILLAEDDSGIREIVPKMLGRYGYTVLAPEAPLEAAGIAARHPGAIDLFITDIVMPGVSGPVLAQRIVGTRPGIQVLFVSGYLPTATQYPGAMSINAGFLQKPFTGRTIAAKVRECLDRQRPGDQRIRDLG